MKLNEFRKTVKESGQFNITNRASDIDVTNYLKEDYVKSYPSFKKLAYSAFSLVFIAIIGIYGYLSFNPVTTLTIDINPSMELRLNIFNRVIDIETYNTESEEFVSNLDYKNKKLDNVLDEIYIEAISESYFTEDSAYMLVGVYTDNNDTEASINNLVSNIEDITVISFSSVDVDTYSRSYESLGSQEAVAGGDDPTNDSFDGNYDSSAEDDTTEIYMDSFYLFDLNIQELAEEYNVSQTKVIMVLNIIDYLNDYTYEEDFSFLINSDIDDLIIIYNQID